jgi:hypothetical protein
MAGIPRKVYTKGRDVRDDSKARSEGPTLSRKATTIVCSSPLLEVIANSGGSRVPEDPA